MSGRYRTYGRRSYSTGYRFKRSRTGRGNIGTVVKRARGNLRAANQQNDISNVTINLMHSCYAGVDAAYYDNNGTPSFFPLGVTAVNIYEMLKRSSFYKSYANMYDQFRVTSVKVKITPTQWQTYDQARSTVNNPDEAKISSIRTIVPAPNDIIYKYNPEYITQIQDDLGQVAFIRKPPSPVTFTANKQLYLATIDGQFIDPTNQDGSLNYVATSVSQTTQASLADESGVYPDTITGSTAIGKLMFKYTINTSSGAVNEEITDPVYDGQYKETQKYRNRYIFPQALTVVTAWDRSGLDAQQIDNCNGYFIPNPDSNQYIKMSDPVDRDLGYFVNIGDEITSYSSAQTKQLVAGATFNCIRYLYPSSQQEKSVYYSTSSLTDSYKDKNFLYYLKQPVNNKDYASSLTSVFSDPTIPFKPTLLIGVLGSKDITDAINNNTVDVYNCIKPVKFNLEFDIGVTFRGLRKSEVM